MTQAAMIMTPAAKKVILILFLLFIISRRSRRRWLEGPGDVYYLQGLEEAERAHREHEDGQYRDIRIASPRDQKGENTDDAQERTGEAGGCPERDEDVYHFVHDLRPGFAGTD